MMEFINSFNFVFYDTLAFIRLVFPLALCLGILATCVSSVFMYIKYLREKK